MFTMNLVWAAVHEAVLNRDNDSLISNAKYNKKGFSIHTHTNCNDQMKKKS